MRSHLKAGCTLLWLYSGREARLVASPYQFFVYQNNNNNNNKSEIFACWVVLAVRSSTLNHHT